MKRASVFGGLVVALVSSTLALVAPTPPAVADVPPFYKIGYGDFSDTYLVNPDGTGTQLIANAFAGQFDWTPDGEKLVFRDRQTPGQLYLRNQNGAQFPVGTVRGQSPELSPDGTKIAFHRHDADLNQDVVDVVDVSGNFLATLGPGRQPTWSPDGSQIAFAKRGDGPTVGCGAPPTAQPTSVTLSGEGLAVAPSSGGSSSWLVEPGTSLGGSYWRGGGDPDWAMVGSRIVMHGDETRVYYDEDHGLYGGCVTESATGGSSDVYIVGSGGGAPTNLTPATEWIGASYPLEPADLNASFSPDGQTIAFASNRNTPRDGGTHSLWTMDVGGGNQTLVQVADRVDETDWMTAQPVGDVVRIEALDPCATEERRTPGTFGITRTSVTEGDVDVSIRLHSSSTATPGSDFAPLPDTVTIPDGTNLVNLVVFPIDDDIPEPHETIVVEIVSAEGGLLVGEPSRATIAIADDDGGPPGPCTPSTEPSGPTKQCQKATTQLKQKQAMVKKVQKQITEAKKKKQAVEVKKLKKKLAKAKKDVAKAKKAKQKACR